MAGWVFLSGWFAGLVTCAAAAVRWTRPGVVGTVIIVFLTLAAFPVIAPFVAVTNVVPTSGLTEGPALKDEIILIEVLSTILIGFMVATGLTALGSVVLRLLRH